MVHFRGTEYKSHTSCISEAQKYQGALYKEKDRGSKQDRRGQTNGNTSQAMIARKAYVEDAPEGDEEKVVAVVDVPPRAPTPPPVSATLLDNVNVMDFLVGEETPVVAKTAVVVPEDTRSHRPSVHFVSEDLRSNRGSVIGNGQASRSNISYGHAPVQPSYERYDSWQDLADLQKRHTMMGPPTYVTPAAKEHRKEKRDKHVSTSEKKRKRQHVDELDLSSVKRPSSRDATMTDAPRSDGRVLHSGLTGGLSKLVTDPEFYEDRIDAGPTPIRSPLKQRRREEDIKQERRKSSYSSHSTAASSKPTTTTRYYIGEKPARERHHHDDKHHGADKRSRHEHTSSRRHRRDSTSSDDKPTRRQSRAIEATASDRIDRPASVQPTATNQIVSYNARADLFLSYINKGPHSERGCSMNKVLKRYHRERDVRSEEKEEEDKELWKSLRLRRNERGEIVLFF